jgi:hypothetical protein
MHLEEDTIGLLDKSLETILKHCETTEKEGNEYSK